MALFNTVRQLAYLSGMFSQAVSATAPSRTSRWNSIPVPAVILAKVASDGGCSPRSSRAMTGCFIPTDGANWVWVRPPSAR
jgi:hypothetical protein